MKGSHSQGVVRGPESTVLLLTADPARMPAMFAMMKLISPSIDVVPMYLATVKCKCAASHRTIE